MLKKYNNDDIRKVIQLGFDLELISFELDIPIDELEEIKDTMQEEKNINTLIEKMRVKYERVFKQTKTERQSPQQGTNKVKGSARTIEMEIEETEDLETLKKIRGRISNDIKNPAIINILKQKLNTKIEKIQQKNILAEIKANLSTRILAIAGELANGTLDIEKAHELIDEEVRKRLSKNSPNSFSLTEEQHQKHILIQIMNCIVEQAEQYPIKFPEKTLLQLQQLCRVNIQQAVRIVVENLIARKNFETAKSICDKYSEKLMEETARTYMRNLEKKIRNAEIGNTVYRIIKKETSPQEEKDCIELIQKGLNKKKLDLRTIPLGKSEDGTKKITLADIWITEAKKFYEDMII